MDTFGRPRNVAKKVEESTVTLLIKSELNICSFNIAKSSALISGDLIINGSSVTGTAAGNLIIALPIPLFAIDAFMPGRSTGVVPIGHFCIERVEFI